jgi:hypothetical protein
MDGSLANRAWLARILVIAGAATAASAAGCGGEASPPVDASADGPSDGSSDGYAFGDVTLPEAGADAADDVAAPPTIRRPFLVGSAWRPAEGCARDDWSEPLPPADDVDERTRAALARAWLDDGLQEHASIAAFARFSMAMLAVSAPAELVAGSQRAALDEVRHARACFSLARRYGAPASGPAELRVDDAMAPMSLAELAALTAEEGCVGETLGAILAEEQAARATDLTCAALLRRIARDETRHAELAWRFVAWAVERGGAPVARAATRAIARASAATLAMEARALAARGIAEIVEPAARGLTAGPRAGRASEVARRRAVA